MSHWRRKLALMWPVSDEARAGEAERKGWGGGDQVG